MVEEHAGSELLAHDIDFRTYRKSRRQIAQTIMPPAACATSHAEDIARFKLRIPLRLTGSDILDKLPDDCTLDDVLYHVYVLQRIFQGLAEAEAGALIPHEQVEGALIRHSG